jgi:hypothetical protein
MVLHLSGVVFRRKWEPAQLQPWETPFADPNKRLPQAPDLAADRKVDKTTVADTNRGSAVCDFSKEKFGLESAANFY